MESEHREAEHVIGASSEDQYDDLFSTSDDLTYLEILNSEVSGRVEYVISMRLSICR